MRAKIILIVILVFIAGCEQSYRGTQEPISTKEKITVNAFNCNSQGSGAYITESLKQELQKLGYNITDTKPDVVINGEITVSGMYHTTPEVSTSVVYVERGGQKESILYKGEMGFSKNPKDFAKMTALEIAKKLKK